MTDATMSEDSLENTKSMSLIVTKGTLDWGYPPFILATTAANPAVMARTGPTIICRFCAGFSHSCASSMGIAGIIEPSLMPMSALHDTERPHARHLARQPCPVAHFDYL